MLLLLTPEQVEQLQRLQDICKAWSCGEGETAKEPVPPRDPTWHCCDWKEVAQILEHLVGTK